jgi:bifunctional enzyme CysN/CysC/sulfate adenylyltransferase subunit 1
MAAPNFEFDAASFAASSLAADQNLLRFTTAGSVDDGKSTLIGRLLYDSQAVYEDQLASVKKSRINRSTGPIDFSLLTDGLRAEREQGITIDVAYRYFSTPRRKFIIADTPGHEQYTRNMATGASTADAAIVLIDATKGLLPQSRRHAYIASLLGIRHVVAAVNKMDLVAYSRETFDRIAGDFRELAEKLGLASVYSVPISALEGDNVVRGSHHMKWFNGPSLLQHLEEVPGVSDSDDAPMRFPVQYVIRPHQRFRGFAGTVASGSLRVGDKLLALPSARESRVKSIVTFDGELEEAKAGDAITITLEDELDVSRGDMLVSEENGPAITRRVQSNLVWMQADPLEPSKMYLLKQTTRTVRARVIRICYRVDINTLAFVAAHNLAMNDIASVEIETTLSLFLDPYRKIRATGSFILIDPISNATVAAGIIDHGFEDAVVVRPANESAARVTSSERFARLGQAPAAIVTNETELASQIERQLFDEGWYVTLIDATHLGERELQAAANVLYHAGVVTVFIGILPEALAPIFADHLFVAHDVSVLDQLRSWRAGIFGKKESTQ